MTRICNFPISKTKHCKQPMADDKPNCGRHRTNLSADQLGRNSTVYKKNGRLHVWLGEPDGFYCSIHEDPAYQVLCQLAGETLPCCLQRSVFWKDDDGCYHRDDGPADIGPDGAQFWYQHGRLHRDDGPAIIWPDGMRAWCKDGEYHREDGPALISANGKQRWYQRGKFHRDDGPAIVDADGRQEWWWHGRKITEQEYNELREQSRGI